MPSDEYLGPYWWEVGQHWFRIKTLPEPMLTQICVSIWSVGHTELKDKPSQIGCLSWLNGNKSGYRPWKVLKFDSCLEKCFIVQSALQAGNFPWKVLENDFMVLKNIDSTDLICLCVVFHIDVRKVTRFSYFVIKSSSLLIQWVVFFTVQFIKSIFFCVKFFVTVL